MKFSCIDLSFISANLAIKTNWSVNNDPWGSDHFPITIEINVTPTRLTRKNFKYNLNKLDWDAFHDTLTSNAHLFSSMEFLNCNHVERYNSFKNLIISAIENNMQSKRSTHSTKEKKTRVTTVQATKQSNKTTIENNIWRDDECERAVRIRTATYKSLKYRCTLETLINYKKIVAETRRKLKETKKQSFMNLCQSVHKFTPIAKV
uniref:Endonuclease/exonuclease/phosphatase domain-containing protein n=1 Tax=Trichogramma kaykai TaxID=54128 RepID=A0ABD2WYI4_9HYME